MAYWTKNQDKDYSSNKHTIIFFTTALQETKMKTGMSQEIILLLMILTILIAGIYPQMLYNVEKISISLIECLVEIFKLKSGTTFKVAIHNSEEYEILTSEIIKNLLNPVVINVVEHHQWQGLDTRLQANMVIILNDNPNPTEILNNTLWNADTRFFLILENNTSLINIFEQFWADKVIHAYALIEQSSNISVYAFEPYKPRECDSIEIKIIDEYYNEQFSRNGIDEILNNTRIKNLNGCPINISIVDVKPNVMFHDECDCNGTTHIDGIEGKVLIEIAKKFNMNATYVIPLDGIGWGWIRPSPAGVVGDVYTGRSDIGFGLLAPTIERFESLDFTVPYDGDECITYGVPRGAGARRPTWLDLLISEFPPKIWLWILTAFISTSTTFYALSKIAKKTFPILYTPIYFFGSALGVPSKLPLKSKSRILFISWVYSCFILTSVYQGIMGSKLTVKELDPDINTFQELLISKLKLTGYKNMLRLLQYEHNEGEIKNMEEKFVVTNFDIDEAVNQIAENREIAHVRHTTTFLYYSLINPKARGEIHLVKDCIYHYYPSFVVKKYSPMLRAVNEIITNLKEMGIVQYWRSEYIYRVTSIPDGFLKLAVEHMKGLFYSVFLGYILSLVLLLLEILYYALIYRYGEMILTIFITRNFWLTKIFNLR